MLVPLDTKGQPRGFEKAVNRIFMTREDVEHATSYWEAAYGIHLEPVECVIMDDHSYRDLISDRDDLNELRNT